MSYRIFVGLSIILSSLAPLRLTAGPSGACTGCDRVGVPEMPVPSLTIRWKRLVDAEGRTTEDFVRTERGLDQAAEALKKSLEPLGIGVNVQKAVAKDPQASNRIWINGVTMSMYIPHAKAGRSETPEGKVYRTIEFAGQSFRDIPASWIVQAGLMAAAESLKETFAELHVLGTSGPGCASGLLSSSNPACKPSSNKTGCCPITGPTSKRS
ncbi:MAG: DUF2703 domain-containing protein, partial [Verrucomicrobiota bacterium]